MSPKQSPDFATMTAAQLNDWYEAAVGYRPQVDDPTMTDDDLRSLCSERWDAEFGDEGPDPMRGVEFPFAENH